MEKRVSFLKGEVHSKLTMLSGQHHAYSCIGSSNRSQRLIFFFKAHEVWEDLKEESKQNSLYAYIKFPKNK